MNVDLLYPYDPSITLEQRMGMPMPDKLRGFDDRRLAQTALEGWLAANPETAKRIQERIDNERPRGGLD